MYVAGPLSIGALQGLCIAKPLCHIHTHIAVLFATINWLPSRYHGQQKDNFIPAQLTSSDDLGTLILPRYYEDLSTCPKRFLDRIS